MKNTQYINIRGKSFLLSDFTVYNNSEGHPGDHNLISSSFDFIISIQAIRTSEKFTRSFQGDYVAEQP